MSTLSKRVENAYKDMFGEGWYNALHPFLSSKEFNKIGSEIVSLRKKVKVYPEQKNIFRAFKRTPYEDVKVVFLGMDPYIRQHQATGLSFAIGPQCTKVPFSLKAIQKEIESDLDVLVLEFDTSFETWTSQGVLMLNTALTVEEGKSGSHLKLWEPFTQAVLQALNKRNEHIVYILLGGKAQAYKKHLNDDARTITAPHPAAEAYSGGKAGFYGSKIFSRCNASLYLLEKEEIKWY